MNACSKPVIQIHNLFSPSLILAVYIFENSLNSSSISTILARKRQKTFSKAFGEKETSKVNGHMNKVAVVIWLNADDTAQKPKQSIFNEKNLKYGGNCHLSISIFLIY